MKKILILVLCAFAFSCSSKESPSEGGGGGSTPATEHAVKLTSTSTPVVNAEGGTVDVTFTATDDWKAMPINDNANGWLSLSPESGSKGNGKVTLTATANETGSERSATIKILAGGVSAQVTLTQKQNDALVLGASSVDVESEGGTFSVDVTHNVNVEMSIPETVDWISPVVTKSMSTDSYTFSVSENMNTTAREADIIFTSTGAGLSQKVHVTQKGKSLQELGLPGVYGLVGLEWNYVKGQHQLLEVNTGYNMRYVFMNPSSNKFVCLTISGYIEAGATVYASILQNVNAALEGTIENVVLTVDKMEKGVCWMSNKTNPNEKLIVGLASLTE